MLFHNFVIFLWEKYEAGLDCDVHWYWNNYSVNSTAKTASDA